MVTAVKVVMPKTLAMTKVTALAINIAPPRMT
jgi:hypothetical protein